MPETKTAIEAAAIRFAMRLFDNYFGGNLKEMTSRQNAAETMNFERIERKIELSHVTPYIL